MVIESYRSNLVVTSRGLLICAVELSLQENTFSEKETMIKLWDEAHYREHNTKTPLARFRVREK